MDNYYQVLNVDPSASLEEIKKSYQNLVLIHHPDKQAQNNINESNHYLKIDEAWKKLKDPVERKAYDAYLCQKARKNYIIHETVSAKNFFYDEDREIYFYECKCSGNYILEDDKQSEDEEYIICCDECSLVIKVTT